MSFHNPEEYYRQFGAMAGKSFGQELFRIQLQGGIATVWGLRRTSLLKNGFIGNWYNSEKFVVPAFVCKVGFKVIPSDFFAIGIDLQANLNRNTSLLMPLLSLEFGNLRPVKKNQ